VNFNLFLILIFISVCYRCHLVFGVCSMWCGCVVTVCIYYILYIVYIIACGP